MSVTAEAVPSAPLPSTSADRSFFIAGGTVPPDAASYIRRRADDALFEGLLAGEFCYVLNTRQMGKSSLSVQAVHRLCERGVRTVFLDLTRIGAQNLTVEQWYAGLLHVAGRELGMAREFVAHWREHADQSPAARFFGALRDVALAPASPDNGDAPPPVVIFVDEIDAVRSLPFPTDEFFAGVRACYNARTLDPAMNRLTFCLIGVAAPSDLIQDPRLSPFNIGRRIDLTDFTWGEASPFALALPGGRPCLERVLYWTGGHPYLTQRLCQEASAVGARTPAAIDDLCADLFLSRSARESDDNLAFVRNRLLRAESDQTALLDLYRQVRKTGGSGSRRRIRDDETNPLCAVLRLSGICKTVGDYLMVRNRIYERVFDDAWVEAHLPTAELKRQREAFRRGATRAAALATAVLLVMGWLAFAALDSARRAEASERDARAQEAQAIHDKADALRRSDSEHAERLSLEIEAERLWHANDLLRAEAAKARAAAAQAVQAVTAEHQAQARLRREVERARRAEAVARERQRTLEAALRAGRRP